MEQLFIVIAVIVVWVLLNKFVLPRLGIPG